MSARKGRVPDPTGDTAASAAGRPSSPCRPLVLVALADCYARQDRKGTYLMNAALGRCPA